MIGVVLQFIKKPFAHHDDAFVACADVLFRSVRNRSLTHPCQKILVHDMRVDGLTLLIKDGAVPSGDDRLLKGLHLFWNSGVFPCHTQGVFIINGNPPLKVLAQEKPIGPQANATYLPGLILFIAAFFDAVVGKTMFKLFEVHLQVFGAKFKFVRS